MDRNAEYAFIVKVPRKLSPRNIRHYQKSTAQWASPSLYQSIWYTKFMLRNYHIPYLRKITADLPL